MKYLALLVLFFGLSTAAGTAEESSPPIVDALAQECLAEDRDACTTLGEACGGGNTDACRFLFSELRERGGSDDAVEAAAAAYKASLGIDETDSSEERLEKYMAAEQARASQAQKHVMDYAVHMEQGDTLYLAGKQSGDADKLMEAIGMFRQAAAVMKRDSNAAAWAGTQQQIMMTHLALAELLQDASHLEAALMSAKGAAEIDPSVENFVEKIENAIAENLFD